MGKHVTLRTNVRSPYGAAGDTFKVPSLDATHQQYISNGTLTVVEAGDDDGAQALLDSGELDPANDDDSAVKPATDTAGAKAAGGGATKPAGSGKAAAKS